MDDYAQMVAQFGFGGLGYPYGSGVQQTLAGGGPDGGDAFESGAGNFVGLVQSAYSANGVVFACMLARQLAFSGVRFTWQALNRGRPSTMFGTPDLAVLERPWPGGTTQDLLTRMINDADLAGTAYLTVDTSLATLGGDGGSQVVRLRPDWVQVALQPRVMRGGHVGYRRVGYLYCEGGFGRDREAVPFTASEVAHFSPVIDPLANWRGMSWLTPVLREIWGDGQMTRHKGKFFENGATPNLVVKYPTGVRQEDITSLAQLIETTKTGVENAYKTWHFGFGADVSVVGADMRQITFKEVQGAGETRIAAAARVSPVIVGLSEGLQGSALNSGNYGAARRQFADGTCHPLWGNAAGSLEPLVRRPAGAGVRLWYDPREVPFLREDETDSAAIAQMEASTIRTLVDAGYTPVSVQQAVEASDWGLLEHSGLFSVQLRADGSAVGPAVDPPQPASGSDNQEGQ